MDREELEKILENRIVLNVYLEIERELSLRPGSGEFNHKRDGIRTFFVGNLGGNKIASLLGKCSVDEKFSDLKGRDEKQYKNAMDFISTAIEMFGYKV